RTCSPPTSWSPMMAARGNPGAAERQGRRGEGVQLMSVHLAKAVAKSMARHSSYARRAIDKSRRQQRAREMTQFLRSGRLLGPQEERAFLHDFDKVCLATQLGPAGLWNLETAARRLIASGRRGAFVECGTWRGGALAFFALSFLRQGGDPSRCRLYGFDS